MAILAAALALRNAATNLFAVFHLSAAQQIKVGDYIKLETGKQSYVTNISWYNKRVKVLDESNIIVPNKESAQVKIQWGVSSIIVQKKILSLLNPGSKVFPIFKKMLYRLLVDREY